MTKAKNPASRDLLRVIENREDPLFALVTDLESPIEELRNRARIMGRITGYMNQADGMSVIQLAEDVEAVAETLSDIHRRLSRMTHPDPAIREKGRQSAG